MLGVDGGAGSVGGPELHAVTEAATTTTVEATTTPHDLLENTGSPSLVGLNVLPDAKCATSQDLPS